MKVKMRMFRELWAESSLNFVFYFIIHIFTSSDSAPLTLQKIASFSNKYRQETPLILQETNKGGEGGAGGAGGGGAGGIKYVWVCVNL